MRTVVDGLRDLRLLPGRTALAAISLLVGVLAVIANGLAAGVVGEVIVAESEQRTARAVTYQQALDVAPTSALVDRLAQEAARLRIAETGGSWAVLGLPGRTAVSRESDPLTAVYQPIEMTLVSGDLPGVRRLPVLTGQWLHDSVYPPQIVLNQAAAARFGGVGASLHAIVSPREGPIAVTVVGVVADAAQREMAYLSLGTVLALRPTTQLSGLTLQVRQPAATGGAAAGAVDALMRTVREPAVPPTRADEGERLAEQMRQVRSIFVGVAVAALVLALLSMLNVGLASVRERSRELVIRRAVGARRVDLLTQVLVGALLIGLITAAIALAAALAVDAFAIPRFIDPATAIEPPPFPWQAAVQATLAALATTLVAAALPAFVAARLDIAAVLRD